MKQKITLAVVDKMELLSLFTETREKYAALSQEITDAEDALDADIYIVYALTEEEIAVVEGK